MNPKLPFSARMAMTGARLLATLVGALEFAIRVASEHRTAAISFLAVGIFFLPALIYGSDIGIGGDTLGWYLPAIAKTHALLHSLKFTAIDFSTFNGSSDFFLSPNFFQMHPLVVLFSLVAPGRVVTPYALAQFITLLLAFHSFVALYFGIRLLKRFFGLEYPAAVFAAVLFAFSPHMMSARYSPPFFFVASMLPWAIYGALSFAQAPGLRRLLVGSLPVVFSFAGGYLPLGFACLFLAAVVVSGHVLLLAPAAALQDRLRRLLLAASPFLLGAVVMALYLYSVYAFHKETSSATVPSLFYSAHQMAEMPQGILRAFFSRFAVPGQMWEFSLSWGLIAIVVAALFLLTPRAVLGVPAADWPLVRFFAVIYGLTVLAMFGQFSPVSDMVFYFVPQVGKMHIYQRFLLPAQLLFAVLVALMLRTLIDLRPPVATRIAVAVLLVSTLWAAYAAAFQPADADAAAVRNYVVYELGLALLFALALLVPGRTFVFASAAVLATLPMLDRMYDSSREEALFHNNVTGRVALEKGLRDGFAAWIHNRFPERDVIKYVDITPMWHKPGIETFSKVFPFFVLKELRLSSYGGFTFYLSARADYTRVMPVQGEDVQVVPDWEYVSRSGADFVVARSTDVPALLAQIGPGADPADVLRLPNDTVVVPLRPRVSPKLSPDGTRYENGMFRITARGSDGTAAARPNLAQGRRATHFPEGPAEARLAVDGNTNGDFALGSVTHTDADANAWLEIDLGSVEQVEEIRLWNRTDGAGSRLREYWVFVSPIPFQAGDTVDALRTRPDTWSRQGLTPRRSLTLRTGGARGRYLRIQFDGKLPVKDRFLSLAEVEVFGPHAPVPQGGSQAKSQVKVNAFGSDFAQWAKLDFEASGPATVDYLFWDNPRLHFYLDGQRVKPRIEDELRRLQVGAGRHTVELRYRHWPLRIFWIVYGAYFLALLAVLAWPIAHKLRNRRTPPLTGKTDT